MGRHQTSGAITLDMSGLAESLGEALAEGLKPGLDALTAGMIQMSEQVQAVRASMKVSLVSNKDAAGVLAHHVIAGDGDGGYREALQLVRDLAAAGYRLAAVEPSQEGS